MLDDWREWSAKPGRLTGQQATAGLVVAAAFLAFGPLLVGAAWSDIPASETGLRLALAGFLLVWVVGCGAIVTVLVRVRAAARGARPGTIVEVEKRR